MSRTRYRFGDGFRLEDYEDMAAEQRNPDGIAVSAEVELALPGAVVVPGFLLTDATPTTIGLGDSFVGGFIAALVRGRAV